MSETPDGSGCDVCGRKHASTQCWPVPMEFPKWIPDAGGGGDAVDTTAEESMLIRIRDLESQLAAACRERDEARAERDQAVSKLGRANRDSAQALAQRDSALDREDKLREALERTILVVKDMHLAWDNGQDSRVGKLIIALAYGRHNYRADINEIWKVLRESRSVIAPPDQGAGK